MKERTELFSGQLSADFLQNKTALKKSKTDYQILVTFAAVYATDNSINQARQK